MYICAEIADLILGVNLTNNNKAFFKDNNNFLENSNKSELAEQFNEVITKWCNFKNENKNLFTCLQKLQIDTIYLHLVTQPTFLFEHVAELIAPYEYNLQCSEVSQLIYEKSYIFKNNEIIDISQFLYYFSNKIYNIIFNHGKN